MGKLRNLRELFWPLLEKSDIKPSSKFKIEDLIVDSSHLKEILEYSLKCYEDESERSKSVENKSALFIGTISVVTSVIIGVTSFLVKTAEFSMLNLIIIVLTSTLTLYMSRTIWFSTKALERKKYSSISVEDFLIVEQNTEYYKKLIVEITNKIRCNSKSINEKVDHMTMAHEYFKRAIVVITIYSLFLLLIYLVKSIDELKNLNAITEKMNTITLTGFNIFLLYLISFTAMLFSLFAFFKRKA